MRLNESSGRKTVQLSHYEDGPSLTVDCCAFFPTNQNQARVFHQNAQGWHCADTTAYCLADDNVDLTAYVRSCVKFALRDICALKRPVSFFFCLARLYIDVSGVFHLSASLQPFCPR